MSKVATKKDNTSVLVIVDMQWQFDSSRNRSTQKACQKEIIDAMSKNMPIIFLEYESFGPTLPSLKKLVADYPFAFFRTKGNDDGSIELSHALKEQDIKPKKIIICGVNTECCVASTIYGLASQLRNTEIVIVYEATNSQFGKKKQKEGYKNVFSSFVGYARIGSCALKAKYHFAANQNVLR